MFFFTKAFFPASLFFILTGGTIYSSAVPLMKTVVDTGFFEDLSTFNENRSEGIFSSYIANDTNNIREYFMNNSWNFLLKNTSDPSKNVSGNGFVLNLLAPDSFNTTSGKNYFPNFSSSSEKLVFLVGTSLIFANKLFSQITDFNSDVNSVSSSVEFSDKKSQNTELFFSHPYSNMKNEYYIQKNLYEVDDEYASKANFLINEPHYVKLADNDVKLVYAATDLEVNENLLDLQTHSNKSVTNSLSKVHEAENSKISWIKETPELFKDDKKFKFAADFAVLEVSVPMKDIKGPFLRYLKKLYSFDGNSKLPKLMQGSIDIVNYKTGSVVMSGWSSFSERQKELEIMKSLLIVPKSKSDKKTELEAIAPSSINISNFNTYFSLDFLPEEDKEKKISSPGDNYECVNLEFYPNDESSVLFVNYWIKSKKTNFIFPEKKSAFFKGFKTEGSSNLSEELKNMNNENYEGTEKYNLLISKAKPLAEWKEIVFKHTYFDIRTIKNLIFDAKLSKIIGTQDKNLETSPNIFKIGEHEYLNLSHHLSIPNLDVSSAKGAVALTNWNSHDNELLGIYTGKNSWKNPFSNVRTEGKIMLFVSPWRYDLMNYENNLSKNTLAESLAKKSLHTRLIFPMIFKNKPSDSENVTSSSQK